jgi:hypothetical protein
MRARATEESKLLSTIASGSPLQNAGRFEGFTQGNIFNELCGIRSKHLRLRLLYPSTEPMLPSPQRKRRNRHLLKLFGRRPSAI